jgi:hypothetical protein
MPTKEPDVLTVHAVHDVLTPPRGPLPDLVRRYVERVLPDNGPIPRFARITQHGEMWRRPGAKPRRFSAIEEFHTDEVAFSWHARFPIGPLLVARIDDGYRDGVGWMRGSIVRIPFLDTSDEGVTFGEAQRYLAEIPWVPHAVLANRNLYWTQIDARRVALSTFVGARRAVAVLEFDALADIVRVHVDARPRAGDVPRPWTGYFTDYASFGGVRIPRTAEVRWELPKGPFTYWRGQVTAFDLLEKADVTS